MSLEDSSKSGNSKFLQELLYVGLLVPGEIISVLSPDKPGTLGRGRVGADGAILDDEGRSWSCIKSFVRHYKWGGRKRVIQPLENIRIESTGKRLGHLYNALVETKTSDKIREWADEVEDEMGDEEPTEEPEEEFLENEEEAALNKRPLPLDPSAYRVTLRHLVTTGFVKPGIELEYFRSNHKKAVVLENGGVKSSDDGTEHASLASWVRSMYPNGSAALSRFKICGTTRYLSDIKDQYLQRVGTDNLPRRKRPRAGPNASADDFLAAAASAPPLSAEEEIRLQNDAAEMKERLDKLDVLVDDVAMIFKHVAASMGMPPFPELELLFSTPVVGSN